MIGRREFLKRAGILIAGLILRYGFDKTSEANATAKADVVILDEVEKDIGKGMTRWGGSPSDGALYCSGYFHDARMITTDYEMYIWNGEEWERIPTPSNLEISL